MRKSDRGHVDRALLVTLNNLVVTHCDPVRVDLEASLSSLEWTINSYTLSFAVMLLTGAALGDRFGWRRVFALGLAGCALEQLSARDVGDIPVLKPVARLASRKSPSRGSPVRY